MKNLINKKFIKLAKSITSSQTQKNHRIIQLNTGDAHFPLHQNIKNAGKKRIDAGAIYYTPPQGELALLAQLAKISMKQDLFPYKTSQICITNGSKQALFNACQILLTPADTVLLPSPYWPPYFTMIQLTGAKVQIIPCKRKNNFKLTPRLLKNYINHKTKVLILNNPVNPTGMVYTEEELLALWNVIKHYPNLIIFSDEAYNELIYNRKPVVSFGQLTKDSHTRTLVFRSFSKTYGMTGWRLGYVLGDMYIIATLASYQSYSTGGVNPISQTAGLAALNLANTVPPKFKKTLHRNLNKICKLLDASIIRPYISYTKPKAGFFLWIDLNKYISAVSFNLQTILNILKLLYDLEIMNGKSFGMNNFIRISFTLNPQLLLRGIKIFITGLENILTIKHKKPNKV